MDRDNRGRRPGRLTSGRSLVRWALVALALAGIADVVFARRETFRDFDAATMGRLDAGMWRAYYERRPVSLFRLLLRAHREQFGTGVLRAFPVAYRAGRAAFTFKDGRSRAAYARALPDLERYFASLNAIAAEPFDVPQAARDELEWWIIRREPSRFSTADWERYVAAVAANIYHVSPERMATYARLRVEAMVLRDRKGARITDDDWRAIGGVLERAWAALAEGASRSGS